MARHTMAWHGMADGDGNQRVEAGPGAQGAAGRPPRDPPIPPLVAHSLSPLLSPSPSPSPSPRLFPLPFPLPFPPPFPLPFPLPTPSPRTPLPTPPAPPPPGSLLHVTHWHPHAHCPLRWTRDSHDGESGGATDQRAATGPA
ncbi:unnamed protein product [Closterium sp. NIES-53]